jgi:RHS repeat-associated protein
MAFEENRFSCVNWYDYGARFYDPRIGRWQSKDAKSEKYSNWNNYVYTVNNPIKLIDPDENEPTPSEAARIAPHVYGDQVTLIGGWRVSNRNFGVELENNTGLKSQIYEKVVDGKVTEYTYATAGTEMNWSDIRADLGQPLGISTQYAASAANAERLSDKLGQTELTFVGHSLGGGEAALNALVTGRKAITFNAAGVSAMTKFMAGGLKTMFKSEYKIDAYIRSKDPLNLFQTALALGANGNKHYIESTESFFKPHSIDNFFKKPGDRKNNVDEDENNSNEK